MVCIALQAELPARRRRARPPGGLDKWNVRRHDLHDEPTICAFCACPSQLPHQPRRRNELK